jgi:hypothetical protein
VISESQKSWLIVIGHNDKDAFLSEYLMQFIAARSTDFFRHQIQAQ